MAQILNGKTIAILATDGFEQVELTEPMKALKDAGATVEIVSPKQGEIQGFNHFDKGDAFKVDRAVSVADASAYAGLVLPGGAHNPDNLRIDEDALAFVRAFFDAGKPVAAICHAPWILIDAGVVEGRKLTSFKTIRTDLRNAGAEVVDEGLVTSRDPDDLPAFCAKMIEEFAEGRHEGQAEAAKESDRPVAH